MKSLFFAFFLFLCLPSHAQSFNNYLFLEKKEIVDQFNDLSKKNKKYNISVNDSSGVLTIMITGFETISCSFKFNEDNLCEESQFKYSCGDCSQKHFNEFLNDKYYKWRLSKNGEYISKYKRFQVMRLESTKTDNCTTIVFYTTNWTKEYYNSQIKQ
ncbi:MAG: hypothetical protein J0L87_02590 [Bacteroidetes bacterium]|nr:hypothetical protein [Bacteroidota bacterium]